MLRIEPYPERMALVPGRASYMQTRHAQHARVPLAMQRPASVCN
ncbi:hypothetical protein [Paraburkholderia sp. SG-MS1]|nr:hypothetical protein [Paraburkholderia sp. SG-MS1]